MIGRRKKNATNISNGSVLQMFGQYYNYPHMVTKHVDAEGQCQSVGAHLAVQQRRYVQSDGSYKTRTCILLLLTRMAYVAARCCSLQTEFRYATCVHLTGNWQKSRSRPLK